MRIISILALCVALFFQIGVSTAYANDSVSDVFDIDANGEKEALTDGLLLIRYLFGFRDTNLTENAVGDGAVRATSTDIETYIGANLAIFDIDDNGTTDALTDGLLLIRHLFGFRDDALIENAISTGANRELAPDVVNYIETASIAPPAMIALPLDFELAADSYTIDQFGGAVFAIEADPDNAANNTLKMTRPLGAEWWAGGTVALDTPVDATSGVYSYDLYSTTPLAYVELKFEQDGANFVIMTTTHGGTGWETLSFDTSTGAMTGAPSAAGLVVFTPRITADGSHNQTVDEMYFFDNIQTDI